MFEPDFPLQQPGRMNRAGNAGLALGILAVLLCWTVFIGIVCGVLAVVFGVIGQGRVRSKQATNAGAARASVILGSLGIALTIIFVIVAVAVHNGAGS